MPRDRLDGLAQRLQRRAFHFHFQSIIFYLDFKIIEPHIFLLGVVNQLGQERHQQAFAIRLFGFESVFFTRGPSANSAPASQFIPRADSASSPAKSSAQTRSRPISRVGDFFKAHLFLNL